MYALTCHHVIHMLATTYKLKHQSSPRSLQITVEWVLCMNRWSLFALHLPFFTDLVWSWRLLQALLNWCLMTGSQLSSQTAKFTISFFFYFSGPFGQLIIVTVILDCTSNWTVTFFIYFFLFNKNQSYLWEKWLCEERNPKLTFLLFFMVKDLSSCMSSLSVLYNGVEIDHLLGPLKFFSWFPFLPTCQFSVLLTHRYMLGIVKSFCLSVGLQLQRLEWLPFQSSTATQQHLRGQTFPRCFLSLLVFPFFFLPDQLPSIPLAIIDIADRHDHVSCFQPLS